MIRLSYLTLLILRFPHLIHYYLVQCHTFLSEGYHALYNRYLLWQERRDWRFRAIVRRKHLTLLRNTLKIRFQEDDSWK